MDEITRVGVDLAKRVIQVHAVDASGRVVTAKALARDKFMTGCPKLAPGCLVAIKACFGARYWARRLLNRPGFRRGSFTVGDGAMRKLVKFHEALKPST
jgi:hypothetical protein